MKSALRPDLLRKYNRPGPRYTSYPTALHFHPLSEAEKDAGFAEKNTVESDDSRPLSLYVHLPFCESACWFCGCTKVITKDHGAADRYLDYLEKEIGLLQPHLSRERPVVQLHLGGGTPTFLSATQLRRLGAILRANFTFAADSECGVEIDPRRLQRDQIQTLAEIGFNRASLGVQDHNPDVQKAVHRVQPRELTNQAVSWLREEGFHSVNIDLIYGLPLQTVEGFGRTVDDILEIRPDRLALFGYAHVPWIKPSQKIFDTRGNLPDSETRLALLLQTARQLENSGYLYIGMDHFALPGDDLVKALQAGTLQRNFQGYSTFAETDICALGVSAISQTRQTYRQNEKDLSAYYKALDQNRLPIAGGYQLNTDDRIRRTVIMRLMCDHHLSFESLSEKLGIDFQDYFREELEALRPLEADQLLEIHPDGITITREGRFLLRNIAMVFDAYLRQNTQTTQPRYSKTI